MKIKVETHLDTLGIFAERYVPAGYFKQYSIEQKLEILSKVKGLDGVFIMYPVVPLPNDPDKLIKKLADFNLKVSNIYLDNVSDLKWKYGAFSDNSDKIRKENIKFCMEFLDFCKAVKADSALIWPAHDGFDYPFQVNYADGWKYLVDSIREIGEYKKDVKIAIEYKIKDPRQKIYISNVGKLMMLLNDVGLDNVGGTVDTGHAFMAQESISESLVILDAHNKLFQIHLNDNYRDADPDLICGSINFWENLEFFYFLSKTKFDGFLNVDVLSPRIEREKTLQLAIDIVWKFKEMVDKLNKYSKEIEYNLKNYSFTDNYRLISEIIFK